MDLSSPTGGSINEATAHVRMGDQCSVTYASVDNAVQLVQELGKGCLIGKLDLKEAYRAIPVHPSDRRFLGVSWDNHIYLHNVLPFGLKSAT